MRPMQNRLRLARRDNRARGVRNAAATRIQAATATQIMTRASGAMKEMPAAWPNVSVATLYMPSGKTTLHSVGS